MTHDQATKETFYVAGDVPDPTGADPRARGLEVGHDLRAGAFGHPFCLYQFGSNSILLELDVYALPGQPMYILLMCPWCMARNKISGAADTALTIRQDAKPFEYDPSAAAPPFPGWSRKDMAHVFPKGTGGVISIEDTIACTWEEDPSLARAGDGVAGLSRCGWRVQIVNNVVRDVR